MIWLLVDSSTIGGIESHVTRLSTSLSDAGYRCEVVLLDDHGPNPWLQQLRDAGVPYRVLNGTIRALRRALADARPELLHTHGYKANIFGRFVGRSLSIPVVSSFHAGERGAFPVNLYQQVDELSACLGGRIAVSEAIRAQLPYRAKLVENFVSIPAEPPLRDASRKIGFVGRLSYEKAPDVFCELAARDGGWHEWHVFGDGPMRAELERKFGDKVTFHGLVADMKKHWRDLGLLVMPSRAEGLPMAALEALAEGVPVLATAVGGLPRIVQDDETGWLFPAGDVVKAQVAVARWSAMDQSARHAMRSRCWNFVKRNYSAASKLPDILAAYRSAGWNPSMGHSRSA